MRATASLLAAALLTAGCTALPATPADSCSALFAQLEQATHLHQDAQYRRLPGFAGLRSDRLLAALGADAHSREQRQLWLQRLAEHDAEASRIEIAQLPAGLRRDWSAPPRQAALAACRSARVRDLSDDPGRFASAVAAAQVPDDYRGWARVLGLNPLVEPVFRRGIAAWQRTARQATAPADDARWLSYRPLATTGAQATIELRDDGLGLPQADPDQLASLFARHAPWLRIEQASRSDRLGSPYYAADGQRAFTTQQPRLYQHAGWSRLNGRWHLQLVYQFWFSQRPRPHALDLYGGELDGLLWRVSLDRQGNALLYDSIHPCGCWHRFYLPADSPLHFRQPDDEESRLATRLAVDGRQALTLWLSAGEHSLVWVDGRRTGLPAVSYQRTPLDQLRQLAHPQGRRSLYGPDGLVPGSERLERWLLWPSGVRSAGAMRQWGHHATAFIGRAHFDDPLLLERYFTPR